MWTRCHLLVTHILPVQKERRRKKSIHRQGSTSTFLAGFLPSWQNGDSLIWYMAITILLSQQSVTNYILKNGYTLFHNALIMARWRLNYILKNRLTLPVCRLFKHVTSNEQRNTRCVEGEEPRAHESIWSLWIRFESVILLNIWGKLIAYDSTHRIIQVCVCVLKLLSDIPYVINVGLDMWNIEYSQTEKKFQISTGILTYCLNDLLVSVRHQQPNECYHEHILEWPCYVFIS